MRLKGRSLTSVTPGVNSYSITVILTGVKKRKALEIAEVIQEDIDTEFGSDVRDVVITTAHIKDAVWSKPAKD